MLVTVPTPESIAAFENLSAARAHLNNVSRQLTEALALKGDGVAAEQRYRDLQKEWDGALRALEKATEAYSAAVHQVPTATPCQQKTDLILKYTDAAKDYCEAMTQFQKVAQESSADYDRLHDRSEERRKAVEVARLAMEEHVKTHGC